MFKYTKHIAVVSLSLALLNLQADPGFVHIDNPIELSTFLNSGPDNLTQRELIKENVFRIIALNPHPTSIIEYKKTLEKITESSSEEKKEEFKDSFVIKIAQDFVEKCEAAKKTECIFPELITGSAFLAQDPLDSQRTLLWTVRHNFISKFDRGAPLQFLLFNYKGKLIYNTLEKGHRASAFYYWKTEAVEHLVKKLSSMSQALDFVGIELEQMPERSFHIKALEFSANIPSEATYIYKAGYPTLVDNRFAAYKKSNSDGKSLFISSGWSTSAAHAMAYAMGDFHVGSWNNKNVFAHSSAEDWVKVGLEINDLLKKYYLNFGTEGVEGFSGSPVFNSKGQVIAIFQGAMGVNLEEYYKDFSSIGLHSKWLLELINLTR